MSSGLYRGASGLSLGPTLPLGYPGYWHGTSGLVDGFGNPYCQAANDAFAAMTSQPSVAAKTRINARNASNNIFVAPSATSTTTVAAPGTTAVGVTAWDRSASNAGVIYRDGVSISTFTTASEALQSDDFFVCAYNNAGTVSSISNRPVTGMAWGGHLTAEQHAAVVAALNV